MNPIKTEFTLATQGDDPELDVIAICMEALTRLDSWMPYPRDEGDYEAAVVRIINYISSRLPA